MGGDWLYDFLFNIVGIEYIKNILINFDFSKLVGIDNIFFVYYVYLC